MNAIDDLVAKRAAKAYVSSREPGDWEDNPEQVESGKAEVAIAAGAIGVVLSDDATVVGAVNDVLVAYYLGKMWHGIQTSNYPDQVYTYRHPSQDPVNFNYNSGGNDPNNPMINPKGGAVIVAGTLWLIDFYKTYDDYLKNAQDKMKIKPDNTNVVKPIPTYLEPNNQ